MASAEIALPEFLPVTDLHVGRFASVHHRDHQLFLRIDFRDGSQANATENPTNVSSIYNESSTGALESTGSTLDIVEARAESSTGVQSNDLGATVEASSSSSSSSMVHPENRFVIIVIQDPTRPQPAEFLRNGWLGFKANPFLSPENKMVGVVTFEVDWKDVAGFDYKNPLYGGRVVFEVRQARKHWFDDWSSCCDHYGWQSHGEARVSPSGRFPPVAPQIHRLVSEVFPDIYRPEWPADTMQEDAPRVSHIGNDRTLRRERYRTLSIYTLASKVLYPFECVARIFGYRQSLDSIVAQRSDTTILKNYTITMHFDDPYLPHALKKIIFDSKFPFMLQHYEIGLPEWAVRIPQYSGLYRRWMRQAYSWILLLVSLYFMIMGFYQMYLNIDWVKKAVNEACTEMLAYLGSSWKSFVRIVSQPLYYIPDVLEDLVAAAAAAAMALLSRLYAALPAIVGAFGMWWNSVRWIVIATRDVVSLVCRNIAWSMGTAISAPLQGVRWMIEMVLGFLKWFLLFCSSVWKAISALCKGRQSHGSAIPTSRIGIKAQFMHIQKAVKAVIDLIMFQILQRKSKIVSILMTWCCKFLRFIWRIKWLVLAVAGYVAWANRSRYVYNIEARLMCEKSLIDCKPFCDCQGRSMGDLFLSWEGGSDETAFWLEVDKRRSVNFAPFAVECSRDADALSRRNKSSLQNSQCIVASDQVQQLLTAGIARRYEQRSILVWQQGGVYRKAEKQFYISSPFDEPRARRPGHIHLCSSGWSDSIAQASRQPHQRNSCTLWSPVIPSCPIEERSRRPPRYRKLRVSWTKGDGRGCSKFDHWEVRVWTAMSVNVGNHREHRPQTENYAVVCTVKTRSITACQRRWPSIAVPGNYLRASVVERCKNSHASSEPHFTRWYATPWHSQGEHVVISGEFDVVGPGVEALLLERSHRFLRHVVNGLVPSIDYSNGQALRAGDFTRRQEIQMDRRYAQEITGATRRRFKWTGTTTSPKILNAQEIPHPILSSIVNVKGGRPAGNRSGKLSRSVRVAISVELPCVCVSLPHPYLRSIIAAWNFPARIRESMRHSLCNERSGNVTKQHVKRYCKAVQRNQWIFKQRPDNPVAIHLQLTDNRWQDMSTLDSASRLFLTAMAKVWNAIVLDICRGSKSSIRFGLSLEQYCSLRVQNMLALPQVPKEHYNLCLPIHGSRCQNVMPLLLRVSKYFEAIPRIVEEIRKNPMQAAWKAARHVVLFEEEWPDDVLWNYIANLSLALLFVLNRKFILWWRSQSADQEVFDDEDELM